MIEGFLLLADAASTDQPSGKVNLLGAGWSLTGPVVPPGAIAGFLRIPWDEAKEQLKFTLRLVDNDREDVRIPVDEGEMRAISFNGNLALQEAQQDGSSDEDVPMNLCFAISLPPLPLTPGHTYEWILEVGAAEVASVRFAVRPEA
ncbi:DUF6941 family protein [Nonomuraea sediminis]|uniref:DUF6941 family protein n=1 Tax=Nonomuraea sediminis TaxID=2835864 RepID=UPI001BDC6614|nr:hypothetical protein [Nonomuraea sediminis]